MKIILTESTVFKTIYNYIVDYFNNKDVESTITYEHSKEYLTFYNEYGEYFFNYFDENFYDDTPSSIGFRNDAPILEVMDDLAQELDDVFGNHWKEPMKKFFEDYADLPVKTITTYYN